MSSFYPHQIFKNEAAKVTIAISRIEIYNTLSHKESFLFGKNSTTFRKVRAIFCKYYFYRWIYVTDFSCYLLLFIILYFFIAHKYGTRISSNYFFIAGASAELQVYSRVKVIVVSEVGLLL